MTLTLETRQAAPALDALIQLGTALKHAQSMTVISAIEDAISVVSDQATQRGATLLNRYDALTTGMRRETTFKSAERDGQVVICHLAQSLIWVEDQWPSLAAISRAITAAVTEDSVHYPAAAA